MKTGQISAFECSTLICFILNSIILETNRLLYFICPYIQYEYKRYPAPQSMLDYNYADQR